MGNQQFCTERRYIQRNNNYNEKFDIDVYQLNQIVEKGNLSFQNQDYQQALEYYYQALDGFKIVYSNKHPSIAMTLNNIALIYKQQLDYANALKIYNESLYLYTNQNINEMDHESTEYCYEVGKFNFLQISKN